MGQFSAGANTQPAGPHTQQPLFEEDPAGNTHAYVWMDGKLLARIDNGTTVYYIHTDALGTVHAMTDASGTVVWRARYTPFGQAILVTQTITNNIRQPGQYYDAETGLAYNLNRDYDASLGRYAEADPIGNVLYHNMALRNLPGPKLPGMAAQMRSLLYSEVPTYNQPYTYAGNNPLTYIDPSGAQRGLPLTGPAGGYYINPGNGNIRYYDSSGNASADIHFNHSHGGLTPHGHNWGPGFDRGAAVEICPVP